MKRLLHLSVTTQIFLSLVLAIVAGYAMQGCPDVAEAYIKPLGTIFLNLLKFIVVPLVMLSIIAGILSMEDVSKVGRLGIRALLYFSLTTLAAVTLGLGVSTLLRGFFPVITLSGDGEVPDVPELSFMDQIVGFFPSNILEPITTTSMMQVIVITVFFGFAIVHVGERGRAARELLLSFNEVVQQILAYIMAIAPFGVFCMLTPVVAVNGPQVLGSYAMLIAVAYLCFALHALVVYAP